MESKHNVFVYGTLKSGSYNHRLIKGFNFKPALAPNMNIHAGPNFPFAKHGDGIIKGEIYLGLDDTALHRLDRLEGHPTLYKRVLHSVQDFDGNSHKAWIYIYEKADEYPIITTGEWLFK